MIVETKEKDMKKILVVMPVDEVQRNRFHNIDENLDFLFLPVHDVTEQMINEANVIVGNIPSSMIHEPPNLDLMQLNSAGADEYVKAGVLSNRTILTSANGAYNKTVAEHAFALSLALMKNLQLYRDNQRNHFWHDVGAAQSFENANVVIVGCGNIGVHFAKYVKAFGAHTIGIKKRVGEIPEGIDELYTTNRLAEILPTSDIVVSFLPQTEDTIKIFDADFFSSMKDSAIFVNCGRGSSVDYDALEYALTNNQISAAAIDVCDIEPLSIDSSLWEISNLLISPHVAGGYHLADTKDRIVDIAVYNIKQYLNEKEYINIIDRKTGYKI